MACSMTVGGQRKAKYSCGLLSLMTSKYLKMNPQDQSCKARCRNGSICRPHLNDGTRRDPPATSIPNYHILRTFCSVLVEFHHGPRSQRMYGHHQNQPSSQLCHTIVVGRGDPLSQQVLHLGNLPWMYTNRVLQRSPMIRASPTVCNKMSKHGGTVEVPA